MTYSLLKVVGLASIVLMACSNASNNVPSDNEDAGPIGSTDTLPPVETNAPNAKYEPAFKGQTRIGGVKTTTPIQFSMVTTQLSKPWGIQQLPDGRFIMTEKGGNIKIVSADGAISDAIKNVPAVDSRGQGGLLGITLDPSFEQNRMVYWVFSEKQSSGNLTAVAKGKLSADEKSFENVQVIYRAIPAYEGTLHYGGRVIFDKQGYLLVTTGERSDLETRPLAQDKKAALGKILRITTDGKPAPGNPFANDNTALPEIYSYGHRNVQGIAYNPATGSLFNGEFGPRGGDELNKVEPGKNYGWPLITYGIEYSGAIVQPGKTQQSGLEQPVYYWDPVISPSGMCFYTGDLVPEWKNNLFIASLNTPHIARLVLENDKVVGEERLLVEEKQRFRDIITGKDGYLYAITDFGRLYKIGK